MLAAAGAAILRNPLPLCSVLLWNCLYKIEAMRNYNISKLAIRRNMRWRFKTLMENTREVSVLQLTIMRLAVSNKSRLHHIKHNIIIFDILYPQYLITSVKASFSLTTHQPSIVLTFNLLRSKFWKCRKNLETFTHPFHGRNCAVTHKSSSFDSYAIV